MTVRMLRVGRIFSNGEIKNQGWQGKSRGQDAPSGTTTRQAGLRGFTERV